MYFSVNTRSSYLYIVKELIMFFVFVIFFLFSEEVRTVRECEEGPCQADLAYLATNT